ncbi:pentatricopeptide repeat-containing protein At4g13650-like isoform X2 [Tasmannia lanceolata]
MLGRCIHGYIYRRRSDVFLYNSLLVFYNKCGSIEVSKILFETMPSRDLVSWNAMISGYNQNGCAWEALELFYGLRQEGFNPDLVTLETAIQACAQLGDVAIKVGKLIHGFIVQSGFYLNVYVENSLLLMYSKCGDIEFAQHLFDRMAVKNLFSWRVLIDGYVQCEQPKQASMLFKCMRIVEREASSDLLVSVLQAIKLLGGSLEQVMGIHCLVIVMGFDSDAFVNSSLTAAYGQGGEIWIARRCFDYFIEGRSDSIVSWNGMLNICVRNWCYIEAMELLQTMQLKACKCDSITLVSALVVCTQQVDLKRGKVVHGYIIRNHFESNVYIATALLEFYVRCGLLGVACLLFSKIPQRNVVSWNTMIFGCSQHGFPGVSLNLFHQMLQYGGMMPDPTTLVGVIEAISQRGFETEGKYIHDYAIQVGFDREEFVANSLIAMYAGFGDFDKANLVFCRARKLSTVTWNAMISQYSHSGLADKAIAVFHLMKVENIALDSITLLSLLPGCAHLASLTCCMWIHSIISKTGFESDVFVGTALIDMYAKCGDINIARLVFERMTFKTTVSWNSMILGYGMHGNVEEVDKLFLEMQRLGVDPDIITFLILMSSCSHAGDVEKGHRYFDLMNAHSISPGVEHYSSIVDLLSRRGLLQEAFEFIEKMPVALTTCGLGALLGACRVQGNMEVGLVTAEKLFELDPSHCGYHVLLANMYSESGRWMDAFMIRRKLGDMGVKKLPGWSMVENHK